MAPEPSLRDFTWLSGMSWLQRHVEQRKACYQECVVRRLLLNRPGWDAPLFADLEKQYADDKDSRLERIAERKAHLEEDLIHRYSICEARGYRVPPPQDQDLVGACEKIQRFDAALASGMDLEVAKRAYGDLTVKPPPWDWEKMQGLARLELCRRHPDRRAHLFNWDAKSKEPKQQGPDGYWAALISESIDHLHLFWDGADFHANDVLRLVYLYGDVPVHLRSRASLWRPYDQVGRDPDFSAEAERRILDCLLEFKYWLDEQPRAAVCAPLFEARRRHPKAKDTDPYDLY
jgi:hypothetical protein